MGPLWPGTGASKLGESRDQLVWLSLHTTSDTNLVSTTATSCLCFGGACASSRDATVHCDILSNVSPWRKSRQKCRFLQRGFCLFWLQAYSIWGPRGYAWGMPISPQEYSVLCGNELGSLHPALRLPPPVPCAPPSAAAPLKDRATELKWKAKGSLG